MERLIFLVFIVVAAFLLAVVIEVKYPHAPIMKAVGRAIALLAGVAAIIDILPIDFSEWLGFDNPTAIVIPADASSRPLPALPEPSGQTDRPPPTAPPIPTRPERSPTYYSSFASAYAAPGWGVGDDDDGASGFDRYGYFVRAKEAGRSHLVWNTAIEFDDFVLEVDATPATASETAAVLVAVGWRDEDDRGFLFIAAPNGECGLGARGQERIEIIHKIAACPRLPVNHSSRIRIEVSDGRLQAHIDGQPALDYPLDGYAGGYVGLGVLSYAHEDSDIQATMRFRDLAVWSTP